MVTNLLEDITINQGIIILQSIQNDNNSSSSSSRRNFHNSDNNNNNTDDNNDMKDNDDNDNNKNNNPPVKLVFVHTFVHNFLYRMIDPKERALYHYRLGRRLWRMIPEDDLMKKGSTLGSIVDHLFLGRSNIRENNFRERTAISRLCLGAARLAAEESNFTTATDYLEFGQSLISRSRNHFNNQNNNNNNDDNNKDGNINGNVTPWRENYDLCLQLHDARAELALCRNRWEDAISVADETVLNARSWEDTWRARSCRAYAVGTIRGPGHALNEALDALKQLGVRLNVNATLLHVWGSKRRIHAMLRNYSDDDLEGVPPMVDEAKLATMRFLSIVYVYCPTVNPLIAGELAERMIKLTIQYGTSSLSSIAFALWGAILCRVPKQTMEGYRYGRLALSLRKWSSDIWNGRTLVIYHGGINGWKHSFKEAFPYHDDTVRTCLLVGDRPFAMSCAYESFKCRFDIMPLPDQAESIRKLRATMRSLGDEHHLRLLLPYMFLIQKLSGRVDGNFQELAELSTTKIEKYCSENSDGHTKDKNKNGLLQLSFFARMVISYMFGNVDEAFVFSEGCSELVKKHLRAGDPTNPYLFDGLINVELARKTKGFTRIRHIRRAKKRLQFIKFCASTAPFNIIAKQYLLEAEIASISSEEEQALAYSKYASAISMAKGSGFYLINALSNERAGMYYLRSQQHKDEEFARRFLSEAIIFYHAYGAEAKAQHVTSLMMEQQHQLFKYY